jgi:outer membrane protein TolC
MRSLVVFFLFALSAAAEIKTMTLRQALDLALAQSPDLMLARLDQQKARAQVTIARDPFLPKVYGGSGLAKTWGFPTSINGSAPSIFEARTQMALFDRPQSYQVAQANENLRAVEVDVGRQQDEVVYRVASLFLDAEQAERGLAAAQREMDNLTKVRELIDARVSEGRELPIESKKANLAVLRTKQQMESMTVDLLRAETSLAAVLGLDPDDRVRAAEEERTALMVPVSEDDSIEDALKNSRDLKRLESNMQSKTLEIKSYNAMRLPKINLVAQYSLLGKYNNYLDYFRRFQRNNGELGASFEIPLLAGRAASAYASQAETDLAKLKIEVGRTRSRITAEMRRAFQEVKRADSARDLARMDLDVSREQVTLDLAQMDEGRVPLAKVEQSRATENEKWMSYYEAQHAAETARLNLLRQTGTLLSALR